MEQQLIVVGAAPAGISLAAEARRAGLDSVLVLAPVAGRVPAEAVARHRLRLHTAEVGRITAEGDLLFVEADTERFAAPVVAVDLSGSPEGGETAWEVAPSIAERVHTSIDFDPTDQDVLVVGGGESAAVAAWQLAEDGARVVLCFTGRMGDLSIVAGQMVEQLEREQRATILWRTAPDTLVDVGGYPMAMFADRHTPDLQFDHVVVLTVPTVAASPLKVEEDAAERVYLITESGAAPLAGVVVSPAQAWSRLREQVFPHLPGVPLRRLGVVGEDEARELAATHYNATITSFDTAHNELWRIRVRPDRAGVAHQAGQYCSLGLGYWEPRADDAADPGLESKRDKLIRRSYSISSPIFDRHGYLVDHSASDEIELYVVWVRADADRVPALTPRLALKQAGDRVYLGPKVAGRYTLAPVTDPSAPVVFCATGTGEAPHNAMLLELLRKGHYGPILAAVSVRYRSDLAYLDEHRRLQERYPNYRYLAVPTREPDLPKRYLQDLLVEGELEESLGAAMDPETTHVFLCGNPAMIGLPAWNEDTPEFPEPTGMVELLHRRGFTIDRRGVSGNVHYEEYW